MPFTFGSKWVPFCMEFSGSVIVIYAFILFSDLKGIVIPPSLILVARLTPAALNVKAFLPIPSPYVRRELRKSVGTVLVDHFYFSFVAVMP